MFICRLCRLVYGRFVMLYKNCQPAIYNVLMGFIQSNLADILFVFQTFYIYIFIIGTAVLY